MRPRNFLIAACLFAMTLHAVPPQEAVKRLVDGNSRFAADQANQTDRTQVRRQEIISNQNPFAVIIGCSDSRVPPELLFDQGLGDIFVVRVAGNVAGPLEEASIAYALKELGASVIVVLGHQNCGAVDAVLQHKADALIEPIVEKIAPAIEGVAKDQLEKAIELNVEAVAEQLCRSKTIAPLLSHGEAVIIGGYYSLATGKVKWVHWPTTCKHIIQPEA